MKKIYLLFGIIFSISANVFAQLSVVSSLPADTLVAKILGTGVTVSNITYNGAAVASGTFTWGASGNGGFANGIILTSGSASVAANPNTGTGQGQSNNLGGDPQLTTLTTGTTLDATVLEFDFSVASDSVAFNYIFASDEYDDFVGSSFNDVFGFFISGPGIVGTKNIAIIPSTTTSVAINNVNNGFASTFANPTGPCNHCAYYRTNPFNAITTAYDGLTTVLTAGSLV
ncbi:MAG: choice-of-anchor L domain-containing protein, partial [Bacteroidota bacterium]